MWADALGEAYDSRNQGIDERCNEVVHAVDAGPDFQRPLRAVDETAARRVEREVRARAVRDRADAPHADELVLLSTRIANAMRETQRARLAADVVKDDAAEHPAPPSYSADKNAAADALTHAGAMRALLEDRGPYASDARAIGVLVALDRMEIARKLPKHLKLLVAGPAFASVFGVAPPGLSGPPADRATAGTWLAYLTAVAAAANHPVPGDLEALPDRETYAWSGVLGGFADELRKEPAYADTRSRLGDVVRAIVARLEDELATAQSLTAAKRSKQR